MSDDVQGLQANGRREALLRELKLRALRNNAGPHAAAQASIPRAPRAADDAPLPLSGSQQRLWFIDRLDPEAGVAYHIPCALHLSGRLDRTALKAALDRVVARHEVLRTRFPDMNGQPCQRIGPAESGLTLIQQDLRELPEPWRERELARIVAEEGAPVRRSAAACCVLRRTNTSCC